jgi:hypothetical protein
MFLVLGVKRRLDLERKQMFVRVMFVSELKWYGYQKIINMFRNYYSKVILPLVTIQETTTNFLLLLHFLFSKKSHKTVGFNTLNISPKKVNPTFQINKHNNQY